MLLTDDADRRQTLVLGGTNTLGQWIADFQSEMIYQADLNASVHLGWNILSLEVMNMVLPDLRPDYELTIVGYSLGGAVATISASYLKRSGYTIFEVVTFGAPRITNVQGVAAFADIPLTRVVNSNDPFPHMIGAVAGKTQFGRMLLLFDENVYAYVPDRDPRLQSGARNIEHFRLPDYEFHSQTLYLDRLGTLRSAPVRVEFTP